MSKDGLNKKQLIISSGMAIISFLITVFIGFWTSPFIVSKLGGNQFFCCQIHYHSIAKK